MKSSTERYLKRARLKYEKPIPFQVQTAQRNIPLKTSQELRMLSSVTLDCQVTKIVMNSGSQL